MRDVTLIQQDVGFASGKLGEYSFDVSFYSEPNEDRGIDFDGEAGRIWRLHVMRGFTLVCLFTDGGWDVLPKTDADKDACAKIIRRFN